MTIEVAALFISKELDYALRIMRALARGDALIVSRMSEEEDLPQPYSYKILKKLERASIVRANRGARGGYEIIAPPGSLTLYDIYRAIEGDLRISHCMRQDYNCSKNANGERCAIHEELTRIQDDFINAMKKRTLAEILDGGAEPEN